MWVLIGVLIAVVIIWLVPAVPVNFVGAMLIAVFGFLFAAVSSRLVGLVGSSNNPVSGMAIATLLVSALVLKAVSGATHEEHDGRYLHRRCYLRYCSYCRGYLPGFKTGYLVGSTPRNQQMGELIGVVSSAIAIGGVLLPFEPGLGLWLGGTSGSSGHDYEDCGRGRHGRQPSMEHDSGRSSHCRCH